MLAGLPRLTQDLGMGTFVASATTGVNFVKFTTAVAGVGSPVLFAFPPLNASQAAAAGRGLILDVSATDLSAAGYARNGAFALSLSSGTPVTVSLLDTTAGTAGTAGNTVFAMAYELIFTNYGGQDVAVSPGASNGFSGPLGGTAPTFTISPGTTVRWVNAAGWPVTSGARNLKFDPGTSGGGIAVSVGGA